MIWEDKKRLREITYASQAWWMKRYFFEIAPPLKAQTVEDCTHYTGAVFIDTTCIFQREYESCTLDQVKERILADFILDQYRFWLHQIRNLAD